MAVADLSKIHPNALRHTSMNPTYMTGSHKEYRIKMDGDFYFISLYCGGELPRHLRTRFTTFKQCEEELVKHIKSKDKWHKAIYPDKYDD